MAKLVLGVTGSVAAVRTAVLCTALAEQGHTVRVVLTEAAEYFFDADQLPAERVFRDADEWPRRREGERFRMGDPVLHIELRRWADLLLLAPLDAHTLAKLALGLCDNLLTCVYRAWERSRPIVLVPAMNTAMWEHPTTSRHLLQLLFDHSPIPPPIQSTAGTDALTFCQLINQHCPKLHIVPPVVKRLACGDEGLGALADVPTILAVIRDVLRAAQQANVRPM